MEFCKTVVGVLDASENVASVFFIVELDIGSQVSFTSIFQVCFIESFQNFGARIFGNKSLLTNWLLSRSFGSRVSQVSRADGGSLVSGNSHDSVFLRQLVSLSLAFLVNRRVLNNDEGISSVLLGQWRAFAVSSHVERKLVSVSLLGQLGLKMERDSNTFSILSMLLLGRI